MYHKISPLPSLPQPRLIRRGEKEGDIASLWQREGRRDFFNNVVILMASLAKGLKQARKLCKLNNLLLREGCLAVILNLFQDLCEYDLKKRDSEINSE